MKRSFRRTAIRLVTPAVATAFLLSAGPCWAAPTAGDLPWDRTLIALQNFMIDSMAPAIIVLAFALAGILYALGGHDKQAGRLVGSGIGGCIALVVVYLLNYVLP
ncbi:MAG: TrbC/VirB2 family protein [Candidatus Binataceae bacterium]